MERQHDNEVQEIIKNLMRPQPTFIGIEGGPCGGKTTLVERAKVRAQELGLDLVVLPEVASQHINRLTENGLTLPWLMQHDREGYVAVETAILADILEQSRAAKTQYAGSETLILSDRVDIKSYVTPSEYNKLCKKLSISTAAALHSTDTLLYLPSVATLAPHLYDSLKSTNVARYESLAEAKTTCANNFATIKTHPELHVLGGHDFEIEMESGLNYIFAKDNEYEAKWIPTDSQMAADFIDQAQADGHLLNVNYITQTYHQADDGTAFRLRHGRGLDDHDYYHFAIKEKTPTGNKEIRRTIDLTTYKKLLQETACIGQLEKRRYSVLHNWQLWHCDEVGDTNGPSAFWIFEAEVSHPDELQTLKLPANLEPVDFDTKQYAIDNLAKFANL
ncbi:MAG TPA: AAA family ATPase [Candidatus Saccharimonadales bacterium]|jgi:CYTH domain-containing protein/predicted ATPase|nr:AAA family ATPase [Candidatus Saccharimonadales bacterium]